MQLYLFILFLLFSFHAHAQSLNGCYGGVALQEVVNSKDAVSPAIIYKTIEDVAPGASLLKIEFCSSPKGQSYEVVVLKENGDVVKFSFDGKTGAVMK